MLLFTHILNKVGCLIEKLRLEMQEVPLKFKTNAALESYFSADKNLIRPHNVGYASNPNHILGILKIF